MGATVLRCNGSTNVSYGTFAAVGDASIQVCVDDPVGSPDDATTYHNCSNAASLAKNGYENFPAFTTPHRTITQVDLFVRNLTNGGGSGVSYTGRLYFRGKAAYADYQWWSATGYSTWTNRTATLANCPDTGVPWVTADLGAPQIKIESADASNIHTHNVTSSYITVTFTPRAGMGGIRRSAYSLVPLLGASLGLEHVPAMAQHLWSAQSTILTAAEWLQFLGRLR